MMPLLIALSCSLCGVLQVSSLRRSALGQGHVAGLFFRFVLVAVALTSAALLEQLRVGALGWAVGFIGSFALTLRRWA